MQSLFSGTTEEFSKLVPVTISFSMEPVLPALDATADELLSRFLGDSVAEQICTLVDELPALNDLPEGMTPTDRRHLERALKLAQSAVAKIGFAAYLPFAEIQIGDDGVTVTAQEGRKAAFEYQTKRIEKQLLETGWQDMDNLVKLIAAQTSLFPGFSEAPNYKEHQAALFKNPAEFSKYYPIQDKWLTFWALRPFMQAVEDDRGELANERIKALPEQTPADKVTRLRRTLLRALAYETVILATPKLSVELNGANVQVNYASQYGNATYYQPPGREHLDWVMNSLRLDVDLTWQTFESQLAALLPAPVTGTDEGIGLIENNGHGLIML